MAVFPLVEPEYVSAPTGDSATVVYRVSGIRGDEFSACQQALAAIPFDKAENNQYPGVPSLLVQQIRVVPSQGIGGTTDTTVFVVTVQFAEVPPETTAATIWQASSTLVDEDSVYDVSGNKITVEYSYVAGSTRDVALIPTGGGAYNYVDTTTTTTVDDLKTVPVSRQVPSIQYTASQFYPGATLTTLSRYLDASGCVNNADFLGRTKGQLLCQVQGCYQKGDGFQIEFNFIKAPSDTWAKRVYYTRDDGSIPPDLIDGVGTKVVEVYKGFDFSTLGLTTQ